MTDNKPFNPVELVDGVSISELMDNKVNGGLTYNDILILPGYITFPSDAVNITSKLTKNLTLNSPFISSPMDTVTEAQMAIHLALLGGIGIIHHNCSIEKQCAMVQTVKKYRNGWISDPIIISPNQTLSEIYQLQKIHGFSGFPVTLDGKINSKLVGLITSRDIDFQTTKSIANKNAASDILVKDVMSKDLLVGDKGISLEEAYELLASSRKSKLPIVDSKGNLVSLITLADLKKKKDFPLASINKFNQLIVGAAISTRFIELSIFQMTKIFKVFYSIKDQKTK